MPSDTSAARFLEKVMAHLIQEGVTSPAAPGQPVDPKLASFTCVAREGPDPAPADAENETNGGTVVDYPLGVFAVMEDGNTKEVIFKSGVYSNASRLVVVSESDDTSLPDHERLLSACERVLRSLEWPQRWTDDENAANSVTITGLDVAGQPMPVEDSQNRCHVFNLTVASNTNLPPP